MVLVPHGGRSSHQLIEVPWYTIQAYKMAKQSLDNLHLRLLAMYKNRLNLEVINLIELLSFLLENH